MAGDVVATLPAGASVEVLGKEDNWYWVVLPPDQHGVRRSGWINGMLLEGGTPVAATNGTPPSSSQESVTRSARKRRLMVQAVSGATLGNELSSVAGGAAAASLTPTWSVTLEMGRLGDVASNDMRDRMTAAAERAEQILGLVTGLRYDVDAEAEMTAFYGNAGVQYTVARATRSRPYAGAHFGLARVTPSARLLIEGDDVTGNFLSARDIPEQRTRLLAGFGTGVNIQLVNALTLDVGFRYSRLYVEEGVNVSRIFAALGYGF
jgi:opacity protein-like surface antigen